MDNLNYVNTESNSSIHSDYEVYTTKKKYYSRFLWKLAVSLISIHVVQIIFVTPVSVLSILKDYPLAADNAFLSVVCNLASELSSYLNLIMVPLGDFAGILVLYLLTRKDESTRGEKKSVKFKYLITCIFACWGFGLVGNIIGKIFNICAYIPAVLAALVCILIGGQVPSSLVNTGGDLSVLGGLTSANDSLVYIILVGLIVGIIGPIAEELLFRKLLVDKTLKYGIGASVMISGLFFGLFHGNFQQVFYAMVLGMICAYLYAYSGKIGYSILIHIAFNSYTAFVSPICQKFVTNDFLDLLSTSLADALFGNFNSFVHLINDNPIAIFAFIVQLITILILLAFELAGIVVIICNIKKFFKFRKTLFLGEIGTKKAALLNLGSFIVAAYCILSFLLYYGGVCVGVIVIMMSGAII